MQRKGHDVGRDVELAAERRQASGGSAALDRRHRRERTTDLLERHRHIDQRPTVAAQVRGHAHGGETELDELVPERGIEPGSCGRAYATGRTLLGEEASI